MDMLFNNVCVEFIGLCQNGYLDMLFSETHWLYKMLAEGSKYYHLTS